jgi:hypothetical protein
MWCRLPVCMCDGRVRRVDDDVYCATVRACVRACVRVDDELSQR